MSQQTADQSSLEAFADVMAESIGGSAALRYAEEQEERERAAGQQPCHDAGAESP